jgi:hypothetical protein
MSLFHACFTIGLVGAVLFTGLFLWKRPPFYRTPTILDLPLWPKVYLYVASAFATLLEGSLAYLVLGGRV